MSLLFGVVVRSIGNIPHDLSFDWIVFASVSCILRASHSPIVLKIRTRNFSLAATGVITETRSILHRQGCNSLPCSISTTPTNHVIAQAEFKLHGALGECRYISLPNIGEAKKKTYLISKRGVPRSEPYGNRVE